jgi:adenylate cyclase
MPDIRRLAAVLCAGTVGAGGPPDPQDITITRTLSAHRTSIRDATVRFRGRIAESFGQHVLAEFGSVVDAVACAVTIQRTLNDHNGVLPAAERLAFGIGVSLGDVVVDGDHIRGEAVTIATHVQGLAEPGGLTISGAAHEHVAAKLSYRYESLGDYRIDDLADPVRVYRVVTTADSASPSTPPPVVGPAATPFLRGARQPSIAVLPFRDYDVRGDRSYFAEGIVEDIVGALASLPDLFVISRRSTLVFGGSNLDFRTVGERLGVQYVLSGSVRRAGDRIRTLAELCETDTGGVLWTDSLEGTVDDVFALQDRLSERVVTTIAPHVRQAELRRALRKRPESLDAYDFVLRGLDLLYRLRREDFERAREMFARAIELAPTYATPYALTANWYSIRIGQGWSDDRVRDFDAVNRLATAALERDPFDARALVLCGHVRAFLFRDYDGALMLFQRAVTASPNASEAWLWSSPTYSYIGDGAEAAQRAERALRLSPLDPHLFLIHTALALAAYTQGDAKAAVAWGRKATAENPRYTAAQRILIASLVAAGELEEAYGVAQRLLAQEPTFRVEVFSRTHPYRDPARREMLGRQLRAAGLPE